MNNHLFAASRRFQAGKGADAREPLLETTQTTLDETAVGRSWDPAA